MKMKFYPLTTVICICILITSLSYSAFAEKDYSIKYSWGQVNIPENLNQYIDDKIASSEITQGVYYRYMQFYEIPSNTVRKQLENAGIIFISYMPTNTYIVSIPASFDKKILSQYNIRSVVAISANAKKHLNLHTTPFPEWSLFGANDIQLVMSHYKNLDHASIVNALQIKNITIISEDARVKHITIQIDINDINLIASMPFIESIEAKPPVGEPENFTGATNHRSNNLATAYSSGLKYDGTGITVMLQDNSILDEHIDYTGRFTNSPTFNQTGAHGEHTGGTIAGAGNLDPKGRGMAFGAQVLVYGPDNSNYNNVPTIVANNNVTITSKSYSNGTNAGYTSLTQQLDNQIYTMPELTHVFSAGNSNGGGTTPAGSQWFNITGGHKIGKNVMTVAALTLNDGLAGFSSRGPAADGRIKPDIGAKGVDVFSTLDPYTYRTISGTSMSCPGVAGVMAQLCHAYKDLNGGTNPPSALIKSAVLNTAYDLGNAGPDYRYGWGRINGLKAFRLLQDVRYLNDSVSQSAVNTHDIVVPAGVAQMRVMVYWLDPAANVTAATDLVNDLNARMITPSTSIILPLVLNPAPNATTLNLPAAPGVDNLNNVEQVVIDNPAAGTYTFEITGFAVPFGPQEYYVLYEFETNEIEVTYPIGGEGFEPGQQEVIRWDAFADSSTFMLEYTTDNGANWNVMASAINGNIRQFAWNPPFSLTSEAKVRVTRDGVSDESDQVFTIIGIPTNIAFNFACPDSFELSWTNVAGALGYEVSLLGNMYMDSIGFTTGNTFVVTGVNTLNEYWVSVRAIELGGGKGERANAVQSTPGVFNCQLAVDGSIELISPAGSSPDCQPSSDLVIDIINPGLSAISNFPVYYTLNGGTPVMEMVPGPIAPGSSLTYSFVTQPAIAGVGLYNISTWIEIPGDLYLSNDTINVTYEVFASNLVTVPYFENFETFSNCNTASNCEQTICNLTNGWFNETSGSLDDIDWRTDDGGTVSANTGPSIDHNPGTAQGNYLYTEASNDCFGKLASMISPCIDLTNASNMVFRYWYHLFGTDMGQLHVDFFVNGAWIEDVAPVQQFNRGNIWRPATVNLNPYVGQIINIRFRGITGDEFRSDMAIDDIGFDDFTGIEDNTSLVNVQLYPNPATNAVHIELNNLLGNDFSLKILDALGRQVFEQKVDNPANSFRTVLDVENYTAGAYLIQVENENGSTYSKLIIQ